MQKSPRFDIWNHTPWFLKTLDTWSRLPDWITCPESLTSSKRNVCKVKSTSKILHLMGSFIIFSLIHSCPFRTTYWTCSRNSEVVPCHYVTMWHLTTKLLDTTSSIYNLRHHAQLQLRGNLSRRPQLRFDQTPPMLLKLLHHRCPGHHHVRHPYQQCLLLRWILHRLRRNPHCRLSSSCLCTHSLQGQMGLHPHLWTPLTKRWWTKSLTTAPMMQRFNWQFLNWTKCCKQDICKYMRNKNAYEKNQSTHQSPVVPFSKPPWPQRHRNHSLNHLTGMKLLLSPNPSLQNWPLKAPAVFHHNLSVHRFCQQAISNLSRQQRCHFRFRDTIHQFHLVHNGLST